MARLLRLRNAREALFLGEGYSPLRTSGARARHTLAYARRDGHGPCGVNRARVAAMARNASSRALS